MSAVSNIAAYKALTATFSLASTVTGTLNTDFSNVTLSPIGQDSNGVFKFRDLASTDIASAMTATFSSNVNGEKAAARYVLQTPISITWGGVTVTKPVTCEIKLSSHIAHTNLQRYTALASAVLAFLSNGFVKTDAVAGASPY